MAADDSLDCRRASRLMSEACDRALSAEEAESLRLHLHNCLKCRNFEEQLRFLREAFRRLGS